ncbi:MAG TPA: hypothetical protein P5232_00760 [Candidatus Moranbacteria bacterium]|nr:hypothetical protein [Candidatus Moranbacteria bacterium]
MAMEQRTKKQLGLLSYKLLYEILILWLLAILGLTVIQVIMPNFFFSSFFLAKIIIALFVLLLLISYLGKINSSDILPALENSDKIWNKKVIFLFIISTALIVNSFRDLGMFLLIPISVFALIVLFFLFHQTINSSNNQ